MKKIDINRRGKKQLFKLGTTIVVNGVPYVYVKAGKNIIVKEVK